jgi:hypothetical protein
MEMTLHLNDDKQLVIELIDSPLIHNWATEFSKHELNVTEISSIENRSTEFDQQKFTTLYAELMEGIRYYNGTEIQVSDYNKPDVLQQLMNNLHHWCVELVESKHANQNYPDYAKDVQYIGKLNSLCHQCEALLTGGTRKLPDSCSNIYWDQQVKNAGQYALKMTDEWLQLMTLEKHDVYLAKRILGKDYRETYRDNDNPNHSEMKPIGNRIPLAMEIDPLNQWKDLWQLPDFIHHLPVEPTANNIGRIPIGNIRNKPDHMEQILRNKVIQRVSI